MESKSAVQRNAYGSKAMTKPLRKKLNLTQQQLAMLLGVDIRTVQFWEAKKFMPDKVSELQLSYLNKRDCKTHVCRKGKHDEPDEATICDYCLGSILVSQPILFVGK